MSDDPGQGFQLTAKHLALLFVVVGLLISGYLSYTKLVQAQVVCVEGESFDCDTVQHSVWSKLAGIPVAYLGFAGYALIGVLFLLEDRNDFLADNARLILFVTGLIGWLYSMWLVYVQAAILQTFCQWCIGHEVNFTLLFAVIGYLFWRDLQEMED